MVSREEVSVLMNDVFKQCQDARAAGQKEYAHKENNALANFEDEAANFNTSREVVWGIFAGKHWRGIRAYINGHRSQREDVRGRIKDLIVYLILLWAMIDDTEATNRRLNDVPQEPSGTRSHQYVRSHE